MSPVGAAPTRSARLPREGILESKEKSEETENKTESGGVSSHAEVVKHTRVYFRTSLNTKEEKSTAQMVSQYLTTRSFLSLS